MNKQELTPKQQAFVAEYLIDLNATQAAIRAGYSAKTAEVIANQLLNKTLVSEALRDARSKRQKRVEVTQDYVLSNLVEVVERCMQRVPVCNMKGEQLEDANGNGIWAFNANGVNKALELLGKHLGLYTDKIEHSGKVNLIAALNEARSRVAKRN